eukprot:6198630-Pleurochrysis_carterae.AAC.2
MKQKSPDSELVLAGIQARQLNSSLSVRGFVTTETSDDEPFGNKLHAASTACRSSCAQTPIPYKRIAGHSTRTSHRRSWLRTANKMCLSVNFGTAIAT